MRKTKGALKISIVLALLLVFSINAFSQSIGLSPGTTEFKGVLRGDYSEKEVILSTSSTKPIECEIVAIGPAENWFTYSTGTRFTIQPQTHFALKIMVQPPADTPNGNYSGLITVRIIPEGSSAGTGASISTGVALRYAISVSDVENKVYRIDGASLEYTREGIGYTEERKPFNFIVNIANSGNVRLYPKVHIDILSEDKSSVLASKDYSDKLILPTTKQEVLITIPNNLDLGKYYAHVLAYNGDETIYDIYLPLEVVERGSLSISGRLDQVKLNKIWVTPGELVEVKGVFTNDGVQTAVAVFKGKVTELAGDEQGSVVSLLESESLEVSPGQTSEILTYYTPTKPGRYEISGKIRYSNKETGEKSSILNVIEKQAQNTTTTTPETTPKDSTDYVMVIAILVLVAVVIGLFFWRAKKKPKGAGKRQNT
jgi:hypothetical protein